MDERAYGISLGAGNMKTLWFETHRVQFASALESQALASVMNGLSSKLSMAIAAFAQELAIRTP